MARFDVFANPTAAERVHTPYVLDVQNDHLIPLGTRVVIPLRAVKAFGKPATSLNPLIQVEGRPVVVDTAALAPVPAAMLRKPVMNAHDARSDVQDALDTLFGGY
jgi:toxin CcdB